MGSVLASIQGEGPSLNSGAGSSAETIYSLSRKSASFVWSQEVRAAPQMSTKPEALDFATTDTKVLAGGDSPGGGGSARAFCVPI